MIKETRNLLIVASIGVLAGLTLLIFNDQEKVSTLIEQEQKIESRGLPNQAPIELMFGGMSIVSSEELKNFLEKGKIIEHEDRTWIEKIKITPDDKMLRYCSGFWAKPAEFCTDLTALEVICPQCPELLESLDAKADWLNKMQYEN